MAQEKMARVFANLTAGDVITIPGMKGELIVLSARKSGGKQLGVICGCGKHVNGFAKLFYWDKKKKQPANTNGMLLDVWSDKVSVDKGVKEALAMEFACLSCEDDFETAIYALKQDDADLATVYKVFSFSNTDTGYSVIAALRAIGVKITEEQAAALIAVMAMSDEQAQMEEVFAAVGIPEIVGALTKAMRKEETPTQTSSVH